MHRWLFRAFFHDPAGLRRRVSIKKQFHTAIRMSSATTAAVLYASVISSPQLLGAEPEDAKELKHHLKGGGFTNPWDSFLDRSGWQIASAMLM
jgi:hypothetical protein